MKELVAIRLVNWYHFEQVTLRLAGSCQLLGDNSSGKSTILDAVQFVLVGDLTQIQFNKAANERSKRSLGGYVRYKLGSEVESDDGASGEESGRKQRFGRGACTGYVLLQFADHSDPDEGFICGSAMEASDSESTHVDHWEFIMSRSAYPDVDDVPVITANNYVQPARDFRAVLKTKPGAHPYLSVKDYQEELRHRLGALPQAFHHLLVKALGFRPIGQVKQFVMDYLLDPKNIDTTSLQANMEHYKRLEAEADAAQKRIEALSDVLKHGGKLQQERRTAASHRFMALRARIEETKGHRQEQERELESEQRKLAEANVEIARLEPRIAELEAETERMRDTLAQNATASQIRELENEIGRKTTKLGDAENAAKEVRALLKQQSILVTLLADDRLKDLRRDQNELFAEDTVLGVIHLPEIMARVQTCIERGDFLDPRDIEVWQPLCAQLDDQARDVRQRLGSSLEALRTEGKRLEAELTELDRGRIRYPEAAEALLHLLRSKLRGRREARPLCELLEIKNSRWTDAIEGVLGQRRLDILVAPEDFARALTLYDKHKHGYHLPGTGEVFLGGVGLVDLERILKRSPRVERGSLAEQVDTEDELARVYADFALGDVMCCDNEQELRKHSRAVTDSAMFYQSYVARQISRDIYRRAYIGSAARVRRREEILSRRGEVAEQFERRAAWLDLLTKLVAHLTESRIDLRRLPSLTEQARNLPNLQGDLQRLHKQLGNINRREIEELERGLAEVRGRLEAARIELTNRKVQHAESKLRIQNSEAALAENAIRLGGFQNQLHEQLGNLLTESGHLFEEKFQSERQSKPLAEIAANYEKQAVGFETRISNLQKEWAALKQTYNNTYGFAGNAIGDSAADYETERDLWQESKLPEYKERITAAKELAIQQLAEDIIFKLRANLLDVRRQIDELNRALKDVPFGNDHYEFRVDVSAEHRDFYQLIMEAGHFQKDSLFGNAALSSDETRRTLRELFDQLIRGEAREVKSELERRADYREYFRYDLRIHHRDGTFSSYDRVAGDKSGGETQTPYYIAIFASMFRLYRTQSMNKRPTCGLLLLDEAFSKMDEGRIAATLAFARDLKLQLVLATPKEKAAQVAPLLATCLYVHKDPDSGQPTVLSFTKEELREYLQGESGGADAAAS